jgi:hypothetical protein
MNNSEKEKMQELLLKLYTLGSFNLMLRKQFEKQAGQSLSKETDWRKFIEQYLETVQIK